MQLGEKLKDSFIGGLILLTPLIITAVIIKVFLGWTAGISDMFIQFLGIDQLTGKSGLVGQLIVLAGSAVVITLTGIMAQSGRGRLVLGEFGRLVNIVPLYRTLYSSLKNFANAIVENRSHYEKAVVVEYPEKDLYRLGFKTSEAQEEVQHVDGRRLVNVFLPNSPNPTGGIMAIVPDERTHEVDLTVRQALKTVMTSGISKEKVDGMLPESGEENS